MYCPSCGQQVHENLRFCSRCGFALELTAEVLANNGYLPQFGDAKINKTLLTRRNVFRFGLVWFLVATLILLPICAVLFDNTPLDELVAPLIAILGPIGGLLIMLFSLFFQSAAKNSFSAMNSAANRQAPAQINSNYQPNALPAPNHDFNSARNSASYTPPVNQPNPVRRDWRSHDTGKLVMPPSVTEDSTRLLDKHE